MMSVPDRLPSTDEISANLSGWKQYARTLSEKVKNTEMEKDTKTADYIRIMQFMFDKHVAESHPDKHFSPEHVEGGKINGLCWDDKGEKICYEYDGVHMTHHEKPSCIDRWESIRYIAIHGTATMYSRKFLDERDGNTSIRHQT